MAVKLIPFWVAAAIAGGMTLVSAGVSYLMRPKPKLGENKPNEYATNIVDTDAYIPIAYGKCVVPILVVFVDTNPDNINELHWVGVCCMGEIEEIDAVYFDNMEIVAKRDGDHWEYHENYLPPMIHFERRKGTAADATTARRYETITKLFKKWTKNHLSAGVASIYMLMNYNQEKLNSIPAVYCKVRGQKVYDPRDGTTHYSNNPVLCILHYLLDTVHGKGLDLNTQILVNSFIAEANYCNEQIEYQKVDSPDKVTNIHLIEKEKEYPFTAGATYYFKTSWARGTEIGSEDDSYTYHNSALSAASVGVVATSTYGRFKISNIPVPSEANNISIKTLYMSDSLAGTYYRVDNVDTEDTKAQVYAYNTSVPYASSGTPPTTPPTAPTVTFENWGSSSLDEGKYYKYKFTFKTTEGDETAPSPATKKIKTKTNQNVIKIKLPETEDANVTHVVIYRTVGYSDPAEHKVNSDFFKVIEVAIATNYYYDTVGDGSLGSGNPPSSTTTVYSYIDRFNCNGLLDTGNDQDDNIERLLSSCRGKIYNEGGRYGIFIPKITVPETFELTEENIIGDWSFTIRGMSDRANIAKASFINPNKEWKSDTVVWPRRDSQNYYLKDDNNFKKVTDLDLPFTTNKKIAKTICQVVRKESRNNIAVEITAKECARILKVGNLVKATHSIPGWTSKLFWVIGSGLFPNATVRLSLLEYTEDDYNYETLDEDTLPGADTDLGDPQDVPDEVTNVVITEELFTDSGVPYWRLKVSFTNPTSAFWKHSEVYVKPGDSSEYTYYTEVNKESNEVCYIYPIEALTTYYVKFLSVSTLNAKYTIDDADEVTEWSYTVTPSLPPRVPDLEVVNRGNEGNVFGKDFAFRWTPVSNYGDGTATNSRSHMQTEYYEGIRYLVEIFYSGINSVVKLNGISINSKAVRTAIVSEPKFTYTLEDNIEDAKTLWAKHSSNALYNTYYGMPQRQITIKVTSMNAYAQKADKPRELTVTNQSPDMIKRSGVNITPEISAIKGGVAIRWSHPYGEYDISHFQIWLAAATTYFSSAKRLASKVYGVGARIYTQDLNGFCYRCTVAGTTAASETPTFPVPSQSTPNPTYSDGSVTWICDGALRIVNVASIVTVESTDDDVDIASYAYEFKKLDPKTTLYTKIYPFDVYGKGTASEVASGTPGNTEDDTNSSVIVPAQPTGLSLYPKTKINTDGKTVVGIMSQWNKNSEKDIPGYILEWRATEDVTASTAPTSAGVDAGEEGGYDVEGGSYELWLDGEIGSGSNESTTYCRKMLKDIQNNWKYFVRVRAVNTSEQRGSFSEWVSLITSKANNAADNTIPPVPNTPVLSSQINSVDIKVTLASPPDDLSGIEIFVKDSSDFAVGYDYTTDSGGYKHATVEVKTATPIAKSTFYGTAGNTYYVKARSYDNSNNFSAVTSSANTTAGSAATTIDELSKAYSMWKYKGEITSSAYDKVSWTGGAGNELVKKKNDGNERTYTVTASGTPQTVSGTMYLVVDTTTNGSPGTATFALKSDSQLDAMSDPVVICKVQETLSTDSKCNLMRYVDDKQYSVSAYKGGFNRLSALYLDANNASFGNLIIGDDSGSEIKMKDSSSDIRLYIAAQDGGTPVIRISKAGVDASSTDDADDLLFTTETTISGTPYPLDAFKIIKAGVKTCNFTDITVNANSNNSENFTQATGAPTGHYFIVFGFLGYPTGAVPTRTLPFSRVHTQDGTGVMEEQFRMEYNPTTGNIVIYRDLINDTTTNRGAGALTYDFVWVLCTLKF